RTSSCWSATPHAAASAPERVDWQVRLGLENFATVGRAYAMIVPKPVPMSGEPALLQPDAPVPQTEWPYEYAGGMPPGPPAFGRSCALPRLWPSWCAGSVAPGKVQSPLTEYMCAMALEKIPPLLSPFIQAMPLIELPVGEAGPRNIATMSAPRKSRIDAT